MCRDRRRHYDDGFMRVVADLIRGRGWEAFSRPARLGVPVSTAGKWVLSCHTGFGGGGGAHGRTRRQQEIRLRDEARGGARPCGAWADEGRSHGEVQDRESHPRWSAGAASTEVPAAPDALRPKPKGRPKGREIPGRGPAPTREQLLEEENAYLKARVAYLEKVDALLAVEIGQTGTER